MSIMNVCEDATSVGLAKARLAGELPQLIAQHLDDARKAGLGADLSLLCAAGLYGEEAREHIGTAFLIISQRRPVSGLRFSQPIPVRSSNRMIHSTPNKHSIADAA